MKKFLKVEIRNASADGLVHLDFTPEQFTDNDLDQIEQQLVGHLQQIRFFKATRRSEKNQPRVEAALSRERTALHQRAKKEVQVKLELDELMDLL